MFTVIHSQHMHALAAEATCFSSFPLVNTHEKVHTYRTQARTHTYIQRNSSYNSCSGVPSLVMSSYV